eukprot:CAMPEP_0204244860 /NCGR_PEP_ID=MMETSP0361-20130328/97273_1 /ASSEMBLY_ACC=CAM_ASM_000343 /TAXON_ID=268821 /ORGANISM="Scrippsiella Hangoei, Strain SHTV-5" /LENGTH=125 /DNA_ID=CAMNT_0051217965 /DNA_START=6 /DNA_END=381 /DNA_ORIENTATION=-
MSEARRPPKDQQQPSNEKADVVMLLSQSWTSTNSRIPSSCLPSQSWMCLQSAKTASHPLRTNPAPLADDIEGVLDIKAKAAPLLVDRLHQVRGVQIVRDGRLQVRDDQALPSRLQRLCKHCQHLA